MKEKIKGFYNDKVKKYIKPVSKYSLVNLLVIALVLNFFIEVLCRSSLWKCIVFAVTRPHIFIYGALIIALTLSPGLLIRRRYFWYLLFSILWIAGGITNCIVLHLRVTPFTFTDIILIGDALQIWNLYLSKFQAILIVIAIIMGIGIVVACWFMLPMYKGPLNRLKNLGYCSGTFVVVYLITFLYLNMGVVKASFANIAHAYLDYGFSYCFTGSIINRGVRKPKGYSREIINRIKQNIEEENKGKKNTNVDPNNEYAKNSIVTPNVIFVQLESFFDPKRLADIQLSEDPIPNFRSLYERYPHGLLSVPSFGAGTANTEVEIVIGMNMEDFGTGEYPYKTIFNRKAYESAATAFKSIGYKAHAIHNNTAGFYSRNVVFANIGFDTFTAVEMMHDYEKTPTGWAKDECLVEYIQDALDSTPGSDYIFTISVQGHGQYPADYDTDKMPINLTGFADEENTASFRYYCNQINEMDQFVADLVEMLNKRDEYTVLVFYGDHLPTFNLEDDDMALGSIYQTQYVMWNNMGLVTLQKDLEAYQLTAYVMDLIKVHEGTLFKYHQTSMDKSDYLINLKQLEYDMISGKQYIYEDKDVPVATDIQYGIKRPDIRGVSEMGDFVWIMGKDFTEYCVITVNGKEVSSKYTSSHLIKISKNDIKEGDKIGLTVKNGKITFFDIEPFEYVAE